MIVIENWVQHVSLKNQIIKGIVNGKSFTTPRIIFNAPGKEVVCFDGSRYKLGLRAEQASTIKPKKASNKNINQFSLL